MQKNKAIFLDRDGTINVDTGYVHKPEELKFLPGVIDGLRNLQKKGYLLIIITNQSGISRKYYSEIDYQLFMKKLYTELHKEGVEITADYFCPHLPEDNCNCRKPKTGLVEIAVKDFNIDLNKSCFIGDKHSDMETARNLQIKYFQAYSIEGKTLDEISRMIN